MTLSACSTVLQFSFSITNPARMTFPRSPLQLDLRELNLDRTMWAILSLLDMDTEGSDRRASEEFFDCKMKAMLMQVVQRKQI